MRSPAALGGALCLLLASTACGSDPAAPREPSRRYEAPDERLVFFGPGSADIRSAEGFFALGYVSAQLEATRALHVLVIGHADRRGGDGGDTRELAWRRARAVRDVLRKHGVAEARILLGVPRQPREDIPRDMARRAEVFVYDPLQDEASKRLGYQVELRGE